MIFPFFWIFFFQISSEIPRKTELFPTSSSKTIDPCIAIINEMFAVVKDEFLIAVDPKSSILPESSMSSGKLLKNQVIQSDANKPFKSFAWSHPINQLGKILGSLNNLMKNGIWIHFCPMTLGQHDFKQYFTALI